MTLAARLTRLPIAFDLAAAADLRAELSGFTPQMMDLLAATAGCRARSLKRDSWA